MPYLVKMFPVLQITAKVSGAVARNSPCAERLAVTRRPRRAL